MIQHAAEDAGVEYSRGGSAMSVTTDRGGFLGALKSFLDGHDVPQR